MNDKPLDIGHHPRPASRHPLRILLELDSLSLSFPLLDLGIVVCEWKHRGAAVTTLIKGKDVEVVRCRREFAEELVVPTNVLGKSLT